MTATLHAQNPSWAKKATQAVFTLKTFKADGSLLASSNGFFISEQGEAVSNFTPFKGAERAVVIDASGKEWPVSCIMGANDMYDVAKFQVEQKKAAFLPIAKTPSATGATIWLLPYSTKTPACQKGTVSNAEKFQTDYTYYTLAMTADEQQTSSPILNDNGEVIGLLQSSAGGTSSTSYAVSVRFAASLQVSALMLNDPTMRSTAIPKAIPSEYKEALLSLVIAGSTMDNTHYDNYVNRFIQQFPNQADGYVYRARTRASRNDFAGADQDMQQAVKVADKKDDAHYQYALLIMQKALYQNDQPYDAWTLDRAFEEAQQAYQANSLSVYRQLQAQLLYAQNKYAEAYTIFEELAKGDLRNAETFYAAAQCKLQLEDKKAALMLLDSAVNTFSRPYVKTATPYLVARAELSMEMRRYQQAINDMNDIVALEPTNAELWAQKASYELRVNLFDQALESAQECMRLDPQGSDGYLMSGIAQCAKGDKQQGLQNLQKAKELGNDQAQTFIDKYSK